jgi:hypothetical protein
MIPERMKTRRNQKTFILDYPFAAASSWIDKKAGRKYQMCIGENLAG